MWQLYQILKLEIRTFNRDIKSMSLQSSSLAYMCQNHLLHQRTRKEKTPSEGSSRTLAPSPWSGVWESVFNPSSSVSVIFLSVQSVLFYLTLFFCFVNSSKSGHTHSNSGLRSLFSWSPASPHLKPLHPRRRPTVPHLEKHAELPDYYPIYQIRVYFDFLHSLSYRPGWLSGPIFSIFPIIGIRVLFNPIKLFN